MLANLSMSEWFGLLAIIVLLIAIAVVFRVFWGFAQREFGNPYVEGHVKFWHQKTMECKFWHKTLGDFSIAYTLYGTLTRVDNDDFQRDAMLVEKNQRLLLDVFNGQIIKSCVNLYPYADWFFAYAWTNYYEPYAFAFRRIGNNASVYEIDANQVELVKAANVWAKTHSWHNGGCTFNLQQVQLLIEPTLIEANYNMLTQEQRQSAENDPRYLMVEERAVVAALKRRMDLLEPSEVHKTGDLTVTSSVIDRAVRIEWEVGADARSRYDVKGYRKEGGFHLDKCSETNNGTLIVDSSVSGSTTDHPPASSIQFYTFMLVRSLKDGTKEYKDSVRFQVRIPNESDVESLKKALEDNRKACRDLNKPHNERLARLMSTIDIDVETTTALMSAEKQRVERVKARTDFTPEEKDIIIEEIQRRFEAARMQIAY